MAKETPKDVKAADAESKVETAQAPKKEREAVKEPVYSAGEFAANAKKIFGTRQECVAAALKAAGISECTLSEAKEIIGKFLKREVK